MEPKYVMGDSAVQLVEVLTIRHVVNSVGVVVEADTEEIVVTHFRGGQVGRVAGLTGFHSGSFEALDNFRHYNHQYREGEQEHDTKDSEFLFDFGGMLFQKERQNDDKGATENKGCYSSAGEC